MKYLSLQQAMLGMRVIMTEDGLTLKSPAGSAHYDLKGRRHTVKGNADFFPMHLRVKDKRKPNLSRVVFDKDSTTIYGPDGKAQIRMGNFENTEKPKGWRIGDGEVFISNAFIDNGMATSDSRMMKTHDTGKQHAAGMRMAVEDGKGQIKFVGKDFMVINKGVGITNTPIEPRLSDQLLKAVLNSIRSSDLFKSAKADMPQMIRDAVNDAIRNALKPGGAIWAQMEPKDATSN